MEEITGELDNGNCVDVVYLDFAKAFDKVPHKRLLSKLEAHGIMGKILKWIGSWLSIGSRGFLRRESFQNEQQ